MQRLDEAELITIFAEVLEVDPSVLSKDSSPDSVEGWDSEKWMEIVVVLEEALDIELSASEIGEMLSIGATKAMLTRRGLMSDDSADAHEFTAS